MQQVSGRAVVVASRLLFIPVVQTNDFSHRYVSKPHDPKVQRACGKQRVIDCESACDLPRLTKLIGGETVPIRQQLVIEFLNTSGISYLQRLQKFLVPLSQQGEDKQAHDKLFSWLYFKYRMHIFMVLYSILQTITWVLLNPQVGGCSSR